MSPDPEPRDGPSMTPAEPRYTQDQIEMAIDHWRREAGAAEAISRGESCLVCAGPTGAMVACGFGARGQVFRHAECECEFAATPTAR